MGSCLCCSPFLNRPPDEEKHRKPWRLVSVPSFTETRLYLYTLSTLGDSGSARWKAKSSSIWPSEEIHTFLMTALPQTPFRLWGKNSRLPCVLCSDVGANQRQCVFRYSFISSELFKHTCARSCESFRIYLQLSSLINHNYSELFN